MGNGQIDTILDNIGLPYSGLNIALSDSATVGPMDGEILISLKADHVPTATLMARLRQELPERFPQLQFFFQPADIVDQVLNFGRAAPIDIQISGPNNDEAYALAAKLARELNSIPGVVDSHVFQVPAAPTLNVTVDRPLAADVGLEQSAIASNVLVTTNSSIQTAPNFWVDPRNGVSYPLAVQLPGYKIDSTHDLWTMPLTSGGASGPGELLMNVAKFDRGRTPWSCRSSTSGRCSMCRPMSRGAISPRRQPISTR